MSNARNLSKFKPSSSGLVETADIADDAVSTDQIANNAVINTSGAITTTGAFTSIGIDDNADATAITIDSSEDVTLSGHLASGVNKNIDLRDADGHVSGRLRNVSGSNNSLTIEADPDNSASGSYISFKVDTSEKMKIDADGHVTMPSQSCFHVKGSRQNNVPKNATTDIQFNSERFDLNGDFDTSTYTFTAPVTGKYQINIILRYDNGDMDNSYYSLYLNTSNSNYRPCIHSQLSFDQDVDYFNMNGSLIIDMDANDTAKVQLGIPNLGADQVDLELPESVFSGYLVA